MVVQPTTAPAHSTAVQAGAPSFLLPCLISDPRGDRSQHSAWSFAEPANGFRQGRRVWANLPSRQVRCLGSTKTRSQLAVLSNAPSNHRDRGGAILSFQYTAPGRKSAFSSAVIDRSEE